MRTLTRLTVYLLYIFTLLSITALTTSAHEPALVKMSTGYYFLYDNPEGPELVKVDNFLDFESPTNPPTDPPTEPPKDPPSQEEQVAKWSAEVDDKVTSQALSALYSRTAGVIASGTVTDEQAKKLVSLAIPQILKAVGGEERWSEVIPKLKSMADNTNDLVATYNAISRGLVKPYE